MSTPEKPQTEHRRSGASRRRSGRGSRRPRGAQTPSAATGTPPSLEPAAAAQRDEAFARLPLASIADEARLRRRLRQAGNGNEVAKVASLMEASIEKVARRDAAIGPITYPEQLPVSGRREDLLAAIADNQVVIVAGETGSGKTTQLPKLCLELGRGRRGLIGHTQPRRLAARTVATRIAEELDTELGRVVGYAVRFTDQVSDATAVKLMTDGILLAEIGRDKLLRAYDTIIIDEAHERSLNIDFLLGYLKNLLPKRPDLKVIITSATIDPERFAEHFAVDGRPAPIVEVSGRTYPVEVRYRPLAVTRGEGEDATTLDRDPTDAIGDAVRELQREGTGDILVFLSGEREIRDTADALNELRLKGTEVLPLYSRLSVGEQQRVFSPHGGRRVVLATNVAETSVTVPGIHYVIDPGTARISRYSLRTKVQRLPIEPISQASARQRTGRCGRVAEGICIRLYTEDDFESRPAFTEPEIRRTNLAAVILQMASLGLGAIEDFPFLDPPDSRSIRDGITVLTELGALEAAPRGTSGGPALTPIGREIASVPVDPRMGRMLVEAHRRGALADLLVIVSALSIQDVRERPADQQAQADQLHARFTVPGSDFLGSLALWNYLREQRAALSSSAFRRMCKREFLHYVRIREWGDLHGQLRQITRGLGWHSDDPSRPQRSGDDAGDQWADADTVHQCILAGLLSHIGVREGTTREFQGTRGTKFAVFPGSTLARKPPQFVMAAELVETSRLWARTAAGIDPLWAEQLGAHLVKRNYAEPHWSEKRGATMASEKVTLLGVTLVAARQVQFGGIDPQLARELFIRHALVDGQWRGRYPFWQANRELIAEVTELEERTRRRDLVVDDQTLFEFYDRRLPESIVSVRHFESWYKRERRTDPDLLVLTREDLMTDRAEGLSAQDFPTAWRQGEIELPLRYTFDPGSPEDGVAVLIPVALLAAVQPVGFDWSVPGLRLDLATALIKTLPKPLRRAVVPAPDFAGAALGRLDARREPLVQGLARELSALARVDIAADDFDLDALPDHLRMTFVAVDEHGAEVGRWKSLPQLVTALAGSVHREVAGATSAFERPAATTWTADTLGTIPTRVSESLGGQQVTGYPALTAEADGAAVQVFATPVASAQNHRAGLRLLLARVVAVSSRRAVAALSPAQRLTMASNPDGGLDALVDDARIAAIDELIVARTPKGAAAGTSVRDPEAFEALRSAAAAVVPGRTAELVRAVSAVLEADHRLRRALQGARGAAAEDVREQRGALLFPGFITDLGASHIDAVARYLSGAALRLEALPAAGDRDARGMAVLERVYAAYARGQERLDASRRDSPAVEATFWLIEELRISLFAQALGTAVPVSEKRVLASIDAWR